MRATGYLRNKHSRHWHLTLTCKDPWIKHMPQVWTSSAQSNDKTYNQLIKWTFISSSCGFAGCETDAKLLIQEECLRCSNGGAEGRKRMDFSSLNVNLSLLLNIKYLLQIYLPNAAPRRKLVSSLTQWSLRLLCWVWALDCFFYRTGVSVQVPQLWGHHILHKNIKYQLSSISFLVLW